MVVLDVLHTETEEADMVQDSDGSASSDEEVAEVEEEVEKEENGHHENGISTEKIVEKKEKVQKSFLDFYEGLTSAKTKAGQVEFCTKIMKHVHTKTSEHPFVLKRLLQGLASQSSVSRQNHYVCLVEFLRVNSIACNDIEKAVEQHLTSRDETLSFFGSILANLAILRSGVSVSEDDVIRIIDNICANSSKGSFLRILALKGIADYMATNAEFPVEKVLDSVSKAFEIKLPDAKLDSLYFICSLMNSRKLESSVSTQYFDFKDASKKKFIENAVRILTNTKESFQTIASHPLWKELASQIGKHSTTKKFFTQLLQEAKEDVSKGKITVLLAVHLLKGFPESHGDILSEDMLNLLLMLSTKNQNNSVTPLTGVLEAMVKEDKIVPSSLLQKLFECSIRWERIVPGNLVSALISKADKGLVELVEGVMMKAFLADGESLDRIYAAEMLAKLVGHPTIINDVPKRVKLLEILFEYTLIDSDKTTNSLNALPQEAKLQLKGVFFRALDSNYKTFIDNVNLLNGCMTKAMELCKKDQLKNGAEDIWPKLTKLVKSLLKSWHKSQTKETGMFLLLFCQFGLQLFSQPTMAVDVLSELFPLHSEWSKSKSTRASASTEKPSEYEVVVEILLSLLAQNNHLLRSLAKTIFKVLSSHMTKAAIQSLLDAIGEEDEQEDSEEGMEDEEIDNDDDVEEDESEDENDESDVDEKGDDTEGEIDEEEDSDEDDEEENLNELTLKNIQSALGDHAEVEEEADDIDMDEIPEDEMSKLDEKLAMAFKAIGGKKSDSEKKREQMDNLAKQHFKLRVLELIEIYIQHTPTIEIICIIVPSLLERYQQLYTNLKEVQMTNRIKSLLNRVTHLKLEPVTGVDTGKLLQYLITFNCNKTYHAMNLVHMVPKLCLQVLKIRLNEFGQESEKLYMDTLKEYYGNSGAFVNYELFVGAVSVAWTGAQTIVKEVVEKTFSPDVKHHHRTQGLSIIKTYLQNFKIRELFSSECKKLNKKIIKTVLSNLTENLNKSKPNQLIELFDLFKVFKLLAILGDSEVSTVKSSLETFVKSGSKFKKLPKVKKGLKKILKIYEVNIKIDDQTTEKAASKTGENKDDASKDGEKKKSKKKKKGKANKEAAEDASLPSFADFLVDTTEVFVEPEKPKQSKWVKKNKNKKRKAESKESNDSTKKVKSSES